MMACGSAPISASTIEFLRVVLACEIIEGAFLIPVYAYPDFETDSWFSGYVIVFRHLKYVRFTYIDGILVMV